MSKFFHAIGRTLKAYWALVRSPPPQWYIDEMYPVPTARADQE